MTALSLTASAVLLVAGPHADGIAGEALTAGQAVYQKASDGKWCKAQCDGTAEEAGSLRGCGLALNTADATGAPVRVALPGATVKLGAGTAGIVYMVGGAAGALVPEGDLASTNKATIATHCIGGTGTVHAVIGTYTGAVLG